MVEPGRRSPGGATPPPLLISSASLTPKAGSDTSVRLLLWNVPFGDWSRSATASDRAIDGLFEGHRGTGRLLPVTAVKDDKGIGVHRPLEPPGP